MSVTDSKDALPVGRVTWREILFPWMHQSYWGASWMLVLSLHVAATLGVLACCFTVAYPGGSDGIALVVYAACFALVGVAHVLAHNSTFIRKYALRDDHDFRWFDFSVRNVALGVLVGAVALGVAWLGMSLFYWVHPELAGVPSPNTASLLALAIPVRVLILVVVGPLLEEIIWRGYILKGLVSVGASTAFAVLTQGLLFAAMHFDLASSLTLVDLAKFWVLAFIGILFGVARWFSGSLVPSLVAHMLYNLASALAILTA